MLVLSGGLLGMITALIARELSPETAPLAMLLVLASTLIAGRMAPTGPALAHGACAWLAIVSTGIVTHALARSWHGLPPLWVTLLLIEDMALIGRIGRVRGIIESGRA